MRRAALLLTLVPLSLVPGLLAGCRGGLDQKAVGTWTSQQGMKLDVAGDKTYRADSGPLKFTGAWRVEGEDLVFTPKVINGKPVAEIKSRLAGRIARLPTAQRAVVEGMLGDLDRSNYLLLSGDGKTMTTDRAKDKNTSPWTPLTKS